MRLWKADLCGLLAGFVLGGACVAWFWPELQAMADRDPPRAESPIRPEPTTIAPTAPPPPRPTARARPPEQAAPIVPVALPKVIHPGGSAAKHGQVVQMPLPSVIGPSTGGPSAAGDTALSGTGFFIAPDGTLLTAAHVVPRCGRIAIASPFIATREATVAARDTGTDLALLRAPGTRPPAILALGPPNARTNALFVLGYPTLDGKPKRTESWGSLRNGRLPILTAALNDPRETIWFQDDAVTHGFSGGAVVDLDSGGVVGMVRAGVDQRYSRIVLGMTETGIAIGPGITPLTAFLAREAPDLILSPPTDTGEHAMERARRSAVHVMCLPR